jgi:predicted amidohydrolase
MKKIRYCFIKAAVLIPLLLISTGLNSQSKNKARVAIIQTTGIAHQDPFMGDFDQSQVNPLMMAHFNKLLALFEEAGNEGADIVCGPEDMQNIGSYGLNINVKDPSTGKILFNSLAVPVPGPLTDLISAIARKHRMYVIAPIYESIGNKIYNTSVIFDRQGKIIGKHRKTVLPVLETWLVSTGDEFEVFPTDFGNIAVATCIEISYPEIPSIYTLKGADIIFNPTMAKDNKKGEGLGTAPMFVTRARDNSVYIVPVVLGTEGNGIIDFDGNVIAEAVGKDNTVIIAEIDFSKEKTANSKWWETINGTDNVKAMFFKQRRPETFKILTDPNPPLLERYKEIKLTTGDREKQLKAVTEVDYGPNAKKSK